MARVACQALTLAVLLRSHADVYFCLGDFRYAGKDSQFYSRNVSARSWTAVCFIKRMPHCMATQLCAGQTPGTGRLPWVWMGYDAAYKMSACGQTCTYPTALPHPPRTSGSARPSSRTPTRSSGCCNRCGPARRSWRLPGCGTAVCGPEADATVPWGDA